MAWEKELYIASKSDSECSKSGREIPTFEYPKKYLINYQPLSDDLVYHDYGDSSLTVIRAYVPTEMGKLFHKKDRAYLHDGDNIGVDLEDLALNDDKYCNKANYEIILMQPSNLKIRIDFKKLNDKENLI